MPTMSYESDAAPAPAPQSALCDRLATVRSSVSRGFADALAAPRTERVPLERLALQGQELVFKLQEQVLLPAVLQAVPHAADTIMLAGREADLIRDLSALLQGLPEDAPASTVQRGELLAVIDGLASLNAARVDALLHSPLAAGLPWPALHSEVEGLLTRWREESRHSGGIEDEDGDPVGQPPP